jgi:hypothetical protein
VFLRLIIVVVVPVSTPLLVIVVSASTTPLIVTIVVIIIPVSTVPVASAGFITIASIIANVAVVAGAGLLGVA